MDVFIGLIVVTIIIVLILRPQKQNLVDTPDMQTTFSPDPVLVNEEVVLVEVTPVAEVVQPVEAPKQIVRKKRRPAQEVIVVPQVVPPVEPQKPARKKKSAPPPAQVVQKPARKPRTPKAVK